MEKINEKEMNYVSPEVLVVECQVEKGYATTGKIGEDVDDGSTIYSLRSSRSSDWWFDNE
ncbi:MAG: hypothetical protein IJ467_05165 [Bacteroidaceae bacterium]|nr:hypothetical protein [Bacteroidaceae bacterium]